MKSNSGRSSIFLFVGLIVSVGLALSVSPAGGEPPRIDAGVPCCNITGYTPVDGIVTAKETATGRIFQFKVTDPALLKTLKVGQKVWADFGTKKVSVDGAVPCCNILPAASGGAGSPRVDGRVPCCVITGYTPVDGIVSARETATGRAFQFKVADAALLKTLKVG